MAIRGVFFDFFGTLVISTDMDLKWSEWYPSVYPLYEKNGIDIPSDDFLRICNSFWGSSYDDKSNDLTLFEKRLQSQVEFHGRSASAEQARSLARDVSEAWYNEHFLDSEAVEVLEYFRRKGKTALITNFDHPPLIRFMLEQYKIRHLFDSVVISGDAGVKKPMPEIFLPALEETGLSNSEVVYVGDSIMDFRAALGAGIVPVIIRRRGQHDHSAPGKVETLYEKTDALLYELSLTGQVDIVSKLTEIKDVIKKYS